MGGAYFLAKFQAGGAYSGGAYKKKRVYALFYRTKLNDLMNRQLKFTKPEAETSKIELLI